MVHVQRTFTVDKPVQTVVDYLADFSHAEEWDPGTVTCVRAGGGPVAVGSSWHNTSKVLGVTTELEYTLEVLEPGHLTLVGRNDTATSTDDITVREHAGGAEVTYSATIELKGLAKIAAPVMKLEFEHLGTKTEERIRAAIAKL